MNQQRIGLIGSGMVSKMHLKALAAERRAQVRWLADLDEAALQATGKAFAVPNLTTDYRRMLADPELDAVIICTPPRTHVPIGMEVLRAGKHLLVEKPLSNCLEDARVLVAEARRHPDLKVSGCSARHSRLTPKYPVIKKMIDEDRLGRVYHIHQRAVFRQSRGGIEYNPAAKWFLDQKIAGGGVLYDWGVYDMAFHLGLVGEPELLDVRAFCINGLDKVDAGTSVFTVEEHGAALMEFGGGLRYYWERASNAHAEVPPQTTIYGTQGGLRFAYCSWDSPEIEFFSVADGGRGKATREVIKVDMGQHKDEVAMDGAWVDYLCGTGPAPMPLDRELANLEILHRVYRAANWPRM
jgi:predicted dehydrogenase